MRAPTLALLSLLLTSACGDDSSGKTDIADAIASDSTTTSSTTATSSDSTSSATDGATTSPSDTTPDTAPDTIDLCANVDCSAPSRCVAASTCVSATGSCGPAERLGPAAHWRARDFSDVRGLLNGTANGVIIVGDGKVGSAFDFAGAGAIQMPASAELSGGATTTLAAWVRPRLSGLQQYIVGAPGRTQLAINAEGKAIIAAFNGDFVIAADSDALPLDTWTHVAGVVSASGGNVTATLFRNGVRVATTTVAGTLGEATTCPVFIGGIVADPSCGGVGQYLSGSLDEVVFYDRALSDTEVATLAAFGVCGDSRCEQGECSADGSCATPEAVACTQDVPLATCFQSGACDPATGTCMAPVPAPDAPCDATSQCAVSGTCDASGTCVPGASACGPATACRLETTCDAPTNTCVPGFVLGNSRYLWRAEDNLSDLGAIGNHGVAFGQVRYAEGIRGRAFDLPGQSLGVIKINGLNEVNTLTAWVRIEGDPGSRITIIGSIFSFEIFVSYDDRPGVRASMTGTAAEAIVTAPNAVPRDTWVHIAGVTSESGGQTSVVLYVDGVRIGEASVEGTRLRPTSPNYTTAIGGFVDGQGIIGATFDGRIDEVRGWVESLGDAEVQAIYTYESGGLIPGCP